MRRRLAWVLLGVIVLHLALVAMLGRSRALRPAEGERLHRPPIVVRVLPIDSPEGVPATRDALLANEETARDQPAPRAITPARAWSRTSPPASPRSSSRAEARETDDGRSNNAASPVAGTPTSASTSVLADSPAASSTARALDLKLPRTFDQRPGVRNPVIDDPRANTARTSPEQRMATTFDTRVTEEALGDGRLRIRKGDDCVIVSPARANQLFAGDGAGARAANVVLPCP